MRKIFGIVMAFAALSGCKGTTEVNGSLAQGSGVKKDFTSTYFIDFEGHEIVKLAPGAKFSLGRKDAARGITDKNGETGVFVVKGEIQSKDYRLVRTYRDYIYGASYTLKDENGKPGSFFAYTIVNQCDKSDRFTGVSDAQGNTVLFTTAEPCDLVIEFPYAE